MVALLPKFRTAMLILLGCASLCAAHAQSSPNETTQTTAVSAPVSADRPLPDVATLMHDVETNERKSEAVQKDYIFHSVETEQQRDSHRNTKKTTITESDHFWLKGVPVRKIVKKDGKALTPDELAKEDQRIDKEVAKASEKREKGDAQGKETDPRGNEEITVSRLLELGSFTNPRRVQLNGRDTIAVDYAGDPKAKTRNRAEDVIRDMAGTAWVDEQDRVLARVEGHFVNTFKIGAGLVADIQKDTRFSMQQTKINDEVWLPAILAGEGSARALLFFNFNGSIRAVQSDYRKFRTTSTILPGTAKVETQEIPDGSVKP